MDKLGDSVLYHDTDSIIYASNGTNDPPLGNFLGKFTDELEGDIITTFVSGNYFYVFYNLIILFLIIEWMWYMFIRIISKYIFWFLGCPKNYAYETIAGKYSCKIRGFTLNFSNSLQLNFESLKELVRNLDMKANIAIHNPEKITRDAKRR